MALSHVATTLTTGVWLLLSVLFILALFSSALKPGGRNVCSKLQNYTTNVTKSHVVQVKIPYSAPCWSWSNHKCTRYRYVNRKKYYVESQTAFKTVYHCCPGWKENGPECTVECGLNKYGVNCSHYCHCQNGAKCDSKEGECECPAGWTGIYCNNSCPGGSFGTNCSRRCDCEKKNVVQGCDIKTGKCFCKPGYTGKRCESPCPKNTFGSNCMNQCQCTKHGSCTADTGVCRCAEGYSGKNCEISDRPGTTKDTCRMLCNCTSNQTKCNPCTGKCSCSPGFHGTHCENRCPPGTFGPRCRGKCKCRNNAICSHRDGSCDCPVGWSGVLCDKACPGGFYGKKCKDKCQCANEAACDSVSGKCNCSGEGKEDHCEDPIPKEDFRRDESSNPAFVAGVTAAVCVVSFVVSILLTVWVCRRRRHRRQTLLSRKLETFSEESHVYEYPVSANGFSNVDGSEPPVSSTTQVQKTDENHYVNVPRSPSEDGVYEISDPDDYVVSVNRQSSPGGTLEPSNRHDRGLSSTYQELSRQPDEYSPQYQSLRKT